ncbi:helix-turn-helix domain-containing protein [Dactylosporangium sp. CA-139066]|uniref:helix-turn-helix domain-containing protein n=1 Tax=Dactylosporangium sp. CA-139066 TaxID=3239930 RepID=UPI003D8EF255
MDSTPGKTPTEFGFALLRAMAAAGYTKQAPFARDAGLAGSTLNRLIYGGVERPTSETLLQIAKALVPADAGTSEQVREMVNAKHAELLVAAGYAVGGAVARVLDPLATELDDLLDEGSHLSDDDRTYIRNMVDRVIDPYRRRARRRPS